MEEIDVRAWDKEDNKMYTVCGYSKDGNYLFEGQEVLFFEEDRCSRKSDCEIMMYTGLKDKNEIKIYHKDLLRYKDYDRVFLVDFSKGAFILTNGNLNIGLLYDATIEDGIMINYEKVGNIYKNPELLKED